MPIRPRAAFHSRAGNALVQFGDVAPLVPTVPRDGALLLGRVGGDGSVAVRGRKRDAGQGRAVDASAATATSVEKDAVQADPCPSVAERLQRIIDDNAPPLTASSAIDLIAQFMTVVPHSTREDMDRLKMLDKFLNTARALMETRLKTEDAQALSERLDVIERGLDP